MLEAIEIILFFVIILGLPLVLWLRVEREKRRLKRLGNDLPNTSREPRPARHKYRARSDLFYSN